VRGGAWGVVGGLVSFESPTALVSKDRAAPLTFLDARPPALETSVFQNSALLNTLLAGSIINQELATQQCFVSRLDKIIGL
jgi:hypothetical protein